MKTTALALALGLAAPLVMGACSKKSDDAPVAVQATAAPAAVRCPAGSSLVDGTTCKASGQARVATMTWNGTLGDSSQGLSLRNTSGMTLKGGMVSVWFYDRTGKRLDVAGAKKYAAPGDAFGASLKPGEARTMTFPLSKSGVPDGTAQIEAELVKATVLAPDGTDGPTWKNDDLNTDDRGMAGTPSAGALVPQTAVAATAGKPPVKKPAPPPPPPHR